MSQQFSENQSPTTWSDMLKYHDSVQRSKEELERNLTIERKQRYREELDRLVTNQNSEKAGQRKQDEELRERYKRDYEDFMHKERMNKYNMKQIASGMAEESLRDYQLKTDRQKHQKQLENQISQQRVQEIAEQEKNVKTQQQIQKAVQSQELVRIYEVEQQNKILDKQKSKEIDKLHSDQYNQYIESQAASRGEFLRKLREGRGQKAEVFRHYDQIYNEEIRKKNEIHNIIVEKGQLEKQQKEAEILRQKQLKNESIKNSTLEIIQQQIDYKKDYQKIQRETEIQLHNQQLERDRLAHEELRRRQLEKKELIKQETRNTLKNQMEEQALRRQKDFFLSPVEARLNRNDIDGIVSGADPIHQLSSPSFIPGRNMPFETKLQNQYINKSLNVLKPETEAQRFKKDTPQMTDRNPATDNSRDYRPFGAVQNQISQSFVQPGNQPSRSNPFNELRHISGTPQGSQTDRQTNNSSLSASWKKDYLYVKNKNDPYSNPINIITHDYKPKQRPF